MSFSVGIVGLPNVGKSTLFKALTKKQVDTSNYPFCTIDPNVGVVAVPDERLDNLSKILKPDKIIPTTIEFYDIAGLVKGAHKGEGLGNSFLSQIRRVDAIGHMIRNFESTNVTHVSGAINPISDAMVVNLELIMSDLFMVKRRLSGLRPKATSGDRKTIKIVSVLDKLENFLRDVRPAREIVLNEQENEIAKDFQLLTLKPLLYIINQDEGKPSEHAVDELKPNVILSAKLEAELSELTTKEQIAYLNEARFEGGGLIKLIEAAYKLLGLITFYTTQNNILQAWTVPNGIPIAEAAGKIHTDFISGFIRAEVINYEDLNTVGSVEAAHKKGLLHDEGREYVVRNGDIIYIKARK